MSQAQQGKATLPSASSSLFAHAFSYTCNGCGYSSKHRYLYERHVKRCVALATGETYDTSVPRGRTPQLVHRNYRCKQCNFTTTKSKLFLAHRRAVHGDVIKIYPCDICEYASKYKSKLLRHRNLKHKGAGEYSEENAGYMSEDTAEDLLLNSSNHLHIAINPNGSNGANPNSSSNTLTIALNNSLGERMLSSHGLQHRQIPNHTATASSNIEDVHIKEEPEEYQENSSQDEELQQDEEIHQHHQHNSSKHLKDILEGAGKSQIQQEDEGTGPMDNAFNFITDGTTEDGKALSHCALCNYSNPHKWKVANHVRSFHMKKKLFKCSECDFVTGRKIEFCVHKAKTHATSKVYSCIECSYCTISRTNYERHINNHVGGGPIKCTYCSYSSTGEAAVIRHMQEYHPKQQMTPSALKKPPQPRQSVPKPRPSSFAQHHPQQLQPPEPQQQSVFGSGQSKTAYSSHESSATNYYAANTLQRPKTVAAAVGINDEKAPKKFPPAQEKRVAGSDGLSFAKKATVGRTGNEVDCPVCGITFRTEARLRIHMVSHSDEASHHCPLCSLKYKRTSDLNRHMKKKHDSKLRDFFYMGMQEQPLNLSVQPEALVPSNRFSQMQTMISEEDQPLDLSMKPKPQVVQVPSMSSKPYRGPYSPEELKCSLCSYVAKWPSDLKRHAMVHSMEKRYKCEYCQRRYKYQFDLNMHMRRSHHMQTSRPRVSNVVPNEVSPAVPLGMTLPTTVPVSPPSPVPALSLSPVSRTPESPSPPRMRSSSVPPENNRTSPDHHQEGHGNSPLASFRPLLPTPSPPLPPIQVSVPTEVVFAPSSIHDMEHTLPPSMRRITEPIETTSSPETLRPPPVEQRLPASRQRSPSIEKVSQISPAGTKFKSDAIVLPKPVEQAISGIEQKPPRILKMKAMKPQRLSSLTPARKFKCKYCPYLGLYQSEVDRHTRLHTGEKPYKCIYCVYRSAWKGDMKRHVIKHHAPEISMAPSLESIIDLCCNRRKEDNKMMTMADEMGKLDTDHYEFTGESTEVESATEELPDLGYSDEEEEVEEENEGVEMRIERVENQGHERENDRSRAEQDQEVGLDLCTTGTKRQENRETDNHLDFNGNKHPSDGFTEPNFKMEENSVKVTEDDKNKETEHSDVKDDGLIIPEKKIQECPLICDAPPKMKNHTGTHANVKRFKCEHCGKRSNWMSDVRKHIKRVHAGKAMLICTLSETEAKDTLEEYLNSALHRTASKASPARKPPTNGEEPRDRQQVKDNSEKVGDENPACVSGPESEVEEGKERSLSTNKTTESEKAVEEETKFVEHPKENPNHDIDEMVEENNNMLKLPTCSSRGKKYRPYKCSACPRRSNWRWDIMKHIRKIHPSAKMITLSEDVAKATFSDSVMKRPKGQGLKAQKRVEKAKKNQDVTVQRNKQPVSTPETEQKKTGAKEMDVGPNRVAEIKEDREIKESSIPFKKRKLEEVQEEKLIQKVPKSPKKKLTIPKAFVSENIPRSPKKAKVETIRCKGSKDSSKNKQNTSEAMPGEEPERNEFSGGKPILRSLKRYKCYHCPYRSNYRSDIGRHGKRLHRKQQLKVVILDEEEAASTLCDYKQRYAKKKFVLAVDDLSERTRRRSKSNDKVTTTNNQPKNADRPVQEGWMSESAELTKTSKRVISEEESSSFQCQGETVPVHSQQSSRILLDHSNVLTRCFEMNNAVERNEGALGLKITKNCQITSGAIHMYINGENASPM